MGKSKGTIKGGKDEGQEDELGSFCSCPCEGMGLDNDPSYVTKEKGVFMRYLKQELPGVLRECGLLEPVTEITMQEKKSVWKEKWSSLFLYVRYEMSIESRLKYWSGIQELGLTGDTDENMIASLDLSEAYFQNCHSLS